MVAGNPLLVLQPSVSPPLPGSGVDATSELRGLTAANYIALEAQRIAVPLTFDWTAGSDYDTGALVISPPTGGAATEATLGTVKNSVANIPAKGTAAMVGATPVTIATDDKVALAVGVVGGDPAANVANNIGKSTAPAAGAESKVVRPWFSLIGGAFVHLVDAAGTALTKAASTAAAYTDPAVTVEIRPGGSFPAKGTAAMTGSLPFTVATDDKIALAVGVVGSDPGANAINNVASTSIPAAATEGKVVKPWYTLNGARVSRLVDAVGGAIFPVAAALADAAANGVVTQIGARLEGYNGATWDMLRTGLTGVQATVVGLLNTLPAGKYNSTQPTLADTNAVVLQVDSRGNLRTVSMSAPQAQDDFNQVIATMTRPLVGTTYTHTLYTYFGQLVTKALILTGNRQAFSFTATNRNSGLRYFQLHNKATEPAGTNVPLLVFMLPGGSTTTVTIGNQFFTDAGVNFSLGLGWAISTTVATFTDGATANEHEVQVQYL